MLFAALAVAVVISVTLIGLLGGFDGDEEIARAPGPADANAVALDESGLPERVTLTITLRGTGGGVVRLRPGDETCSKTCEQRFDAGTRVTLIPDPGDKSTFEGWEEACAGSARCSLVVARDVSVTATFDRRPVAPRCEEGSDDPRCPPDDLDAGDDDLEAGDDEPAGGDCADGRDNDSDGLTDAAQDPECAAGSTESGVPAAPPPPPPRPPAGSTDDCADGRDNDSDGLTDTAQDPDCLSGSSESGRPATGGTRVPSECRDGKDNDGDGLIDTAQDPGCERDSTEAD